MSTVRAAAGARIRSSARLKERVRHRSRRRRHTASSAWRRPCPAPAKAPARSRGEGLVLVGTSTGGPPALEALLTPLPADFPWPIVVAQHMPATFTGALARRLDRLSALTVVEVVRTVGLRPGTVYIGKGDADIVVTRRPPASSLCRYGPIPGYPWHPEHRSAR